MLVWGHHEELSSSLNYLVLLEGFNEWHRNNTLPLHPPDWRRPRGFWNLLLFTLSHGSHPGSGPSRHPQRTACDLQESQNLDATSFYLNSLALQSFVVELLHLVVEGEMRSTVSALQCFGLYLWLITRRNSVSCSSDGLPHNRLHQQSTWLPAFTAFALLPIPCMTKE